MNSIEIFELIKPLPLSEKFQILDLILNSIKEKTDTSDIEKKNRAAAAAQLLQDYLEDDSLTAFTVLDKEDFYAPE